MTKKASAKKKATDWPSAMQPLIDKYKDEPHPLHYKNLYQLLVMVVLSAQDSDKHINAVVPPFFEKYPDMKKLSRATVEELIPVIGKVRNFRNKINWLVQIAQQVKDDGKIPLSMDGLTALPGIGRKTANVILQEAGRPAEGVVVDLHVVRVAPRLGIASGTDPKKIEQQIMDALPREQWSEVGMAISFLGRETCRPTNPHHHECIMRDHCDYFRELAAGAKKRTVKKASRSRSVK